MTTNAKSVARTHRPLVLLVVFHTGKFLAALLTRVVPSECKIFCSIRRSFSSTYEERTSRNSIRLVEEPRLRRVPPYRCSFACCGCYDPKLRASGGERRETSYP